MLWLGLLIWFLVTALLVVAVLYLRATGIHVWLWVRKRKG